MKMNHNTCFLFHSYFSSLCFQIFFSLWSFSFDTPISMFYFIVSIFYFLHIFSFCTLLFFSFIFSVSLFVQIFSFWTFAFYTPIFLFSFIDSIFSFCTLLFFFLASHEKMKWCKQRNFHKIKYKFPTFLAPTPLPSQYLFHLLHITSFSYLH